MEIQNKPEDPFDFHVYVGFSRKNVAEIQPVIDYLKRNFLYYFRPDELEGKSPTNETDETIEYSVMRCAKSLLYVTAEYIEDPQSKVEVAAAVDKARCFGRDLADRLLVLKDSRLSDESFDALDLKNSPVVKNSVDEDAVQPLLEQVDTWLRQPVNDVVSVPRLHEKITGYEEAFVYFYGYLDRVLRGHRKRMKAAAAAWEVSEPKTKVVLEMLIVVPQTGPPPSSFDVPDKLVTSSNKFVATSSHRGGSMKDDHRRAVMELTVDADEVICFFGEFPACLVTLYETFSSDRTGMTQAQLDNIRTDFFETLKSLLAHPDNGHCADQYRLVMWPDDRVELYEYLQPVVREAAWEGTATPDHSSEDDLLGSSFEHLSLNLGPRALWETADMYKMRDDISPRGICLVVDAASTADTTHIDHIKRLFADQFDFDVRVHNSQMTDGQLEDLLFEVVKEDHRKYDAFVCYLAIRGRLGCVLTANDAWKPVVDLVDILSAKNCESLRDKPKLFLVQTYEVDGPTVVDSTNLVTSLPQTVPPVPSRSIRGQAPHDAGQVPNTTEDGGYILIPRDEDFIVSIVHSPAAAAASVYVGALREHLHPGVNVEEALDRVTNQMLERTLMEAKLVKTGSKLLLFPARKKDDHCTC